MRAPSTSPSASRVLAGVVVATSLAITLATGDAALGVLPAAAVILAWIAIAAPPHRTAIVVFFLAIVADNPREHPAEGRWITPLEPLNVLLYENLNNLTGIGALRFAFIDVLLLTLLLAVLTRDPRRGAEATPRAFRGLLLAAAAAVVWIELWGLARGGDFRATLWQIRALLWAPVIAYVFSRSVRVRDVPAVAKAVVAAALIKAALGIWYYEVVCRPVGYWPQYTGTHSDTVLFATAIVVATTWMLERPSPRTALRSAAIFAIVGFGIIVNQRRLAYIDVAGSLVAIYLVLPVGRLRKSVNRALASVGPLTTLYLAIGWRSDAGFFGPARKVASLFSKEDRSAGMRDIENYNLLLTWRQHFVLGSGFGHEYHEATRPEGIEHVFPLYRYIAHNSVLWLQATGGIVGFAGFWLLVVGLAYFAARSHRFARAPVERAAALTCLCVAVAFAIQAYGDMGLASWKAMFHLGMALAVAGRLAVSTGAFPMPGRAARAPAPSGDDETASAPATR